MNPMTGMNPMGGPVGGAPVPMMNNGGMNPQAANASNGNPNIAPGGGAPRQPADLRNIFNTYIYEYFLRFGMYDCARSLLSSDHPVLVDKEAAARRQNENGNMNGVGDDPMDTDSKDDIDGKLPDGLPPPKLPMATSDSFLFEWFCIFWDIYTAQRTKGGNGTVAQYVNHTQQQSRLKQNHQHEMLRQMRPDVAQPQYAQLMRMQQNGMPIMKQSALARTAMANSQHNPQMMLQQQQAKQNPMQRDPSAMDGNRGDRPPSPASGDNAPSPSKRQRVDGAQFNPNQAGAMMANGRPGAPGVQQMPGNPHVNTAAATQMLQASGINPNALNPAQLAHFASLTPSAQQKSITTYSQNLQQHHGSQMGNKAMPNTGAPQNQGSPMMPPNSDSASIAAFYNAGDINTTNGMRPGPGAAQGAQGGGNSNHALQDYQMQLMLLEQQNKKRLMMARQEQDNMGGIPREGGPGGPQGPNGQPFPEASPQAMRTGASPNPSEQMKRGTPQMNNSGIPSPVPEGNGNRDSPNPVNFMGAMGNHVDPGMAPHFFNKNLEGNMGATQMNGVRGPPGAHPGQPFNGQMNPQQMMAARQQQNQPGQQPQQPGQQPGGPGGPGGPQQWQQGLNGQMMPQGMQQSPQVQGTPQQRAMPPPSAPANTAANVSRTTASPQQSAAAPPTPNQGNKAAPKKKDTKNAKDKRATQKKSNSNLNAGATPSGDNGEPDATPATPITPVNPASFAKNQNGPSAPNGQAGAGAGPQVPAPPVPAPGPAAQVPQDQNPNQNGGMGDVGFSMDAYGVELANPMQTPDVLNDFDFDSFLHDENGNETLFDYNNTFSGIDMGNNEIPTD